jgi:indole-3-glycerol phosphate synthase
MIEAILKTKRHEVLTLKHVGFFGRRTKPFRPLVFSGSVNIIAELKRRSPSAGFIGEIDEDRIRCYTNHAKAISVLTDRTYFGGSPEFLQTVASQTPLPVLCKDFIIDTIQIDLAYAMGADLVLLIARILQKEELETLYAYAGQLGLACLVELHDHDDMDKVEAIEPPIIGVNARNLDTLEMDLEAAGQLLAEAKAPIKIAESGLRSRRDIERMMARGANGFLIGETLMRSNDLETTFEELLHG